MKINRHRRSFTVGKMNFDASRIEDGVAELWAHDATSLACGLGAVHAHDRQVQMIMARIVGRGRISECLADDETTFAIDVFMRGMGFAREAEREVQALSRETRAFAEAYAAGVNHVISRESRPIEFRLTGHRPDPWTVSDTMLTIKLMSFLGLAQSQQDMEKLIIQSIHHDAPIDALRDLLDPHLSDLDEDTIGLIRGLAHLQPLLPPEIRFLPGAPKVAASNNWAVGGARTTSGSAILCIDPHLECNRLPAIWYETVMHIDQDYQVGATMPGVPGLVMGRSRDLSFGFTYGFMDMVDFFIEDCRDGRCRRGEDFVDLDVRREIIKRKKKADTEIAIRENDLGILEADPFAPELADGLYLTRAWSGHRGGAAASLEVIRRVANAHTVEEAQLLLRHVAISCNWVLADREGSIGYQQSGLLPDRRHSGLYPVPAWNEAGTWRGVVPADRLHWELNPPEGFIATANNEINSPDGPTAVNLPMGSYRVERIRELLAARDDHDGDSMAAIQTDLTSPQAARFMEIWRPLLPDTLAGRLLAGWDLRYDVESRGATLFEELYLEVLGQVCGHRVFGTEAWNAVVDETAILADYYHLFDRVLLNEDPFWWGDDGREAVLRRIFGELLNEVDPYHVMAWGRRRSVEMTNIFFDGKLPRFLGFDHGPIELPGNRATVVQGGLFIAHGRMTTFAPSWRFITDMGTDTIQTVLAGGPSGRRFSKWYTTDVERWLRGEYKTLEVES